MERDYFLNRINCEFAVITNEVNVKVVTDALNIKPDRYFNKGDKSPKAKSEIVLRPYGLWAIKSKITISPDIDLIPHLNYLKKKLRNKIEIINKLKKNFNFECVFDISIETEDAGIGIDLSDVDLVFISQIANRFSLAFLVKEHINEKKHKLYKL